MNVQYTCPDIVRRNQVISHLLDQSNVASLRVRRIKDEAFYVQSDSVTEAVHQQVLDNIAGLEVSVLP